MSASTFIKEPFLSYEKRKNVELFLNFKEEKYLDLSEVQNYIPIYKKIFILNETNYNSINLNHEWYIHSIKKEISNKDIKSYKCELKNTQSHTKTKKQSVFFKLAPLLDPYKFFTGKYDVKDEKLYKLPKWDDNNSSVNSRILEENNSAYVDSFFSFLSNSLLERFNFQHGVEFYGSFLAIKNNFNVNIIDDLDYLCKSSYFNKNKNILFRVEDYDHLMNNEDPVKLKPIKIDYSTSKKSNMTIQSIHEELFDDVFESVENIEEKILSVDTNDHYTLEDLKEVSLSNDGNKNSLDILNVFKDGNTNKNITIKTTSTCSSRTSHTSDNDEEMNNNSLSSKNSEFTCDEDNNENNEDDDEDEDEDEDEDYDNEGEEKVVSRLEKFPVHVICMEQCQDTFDSLIINEELSKDEWLSALLQIIMILITYQEAFYFTHNDLHTNNVMFVETKKEYLYYCYNQKYYKVPTFGRIYKIIDFGRGIYHFNGKKFCSDSFQLGGDAGTQYNSEPYFNDKKPRLEPNYSFDLCRLACSIFDYLVDDFDELSTIIKENPVAKLIVDWCIDDNGLNVLYKNNGVERYPDFKLYKMIARCVHNHTPQAQLQRSIFKSFITTKDRIDLREKVMNIDEISINANKLIN